MGFELAKDLLLLAGWPVRHYNCIAKSLVRAVISVCGKCFNWLDIATQFVSYDNHGFAKLYIQSFEKSFCSLRIHTSLYWNIQNDAIRVDFKKQTMFLYHRS